MGHVLRKKMPLPHQVATCCPGCGDTCWIGYDHRKGDKKELPVYRGRRDPAQHTQRARLLYEELPILEQGIEHYKQAYQQAQNRLASLEAIVRKALSYWESHWKQTFMYGHFTEMERCLREQTRDY
jgi:hypothetical protein